MRWLHLVLFIAAIAITVAEPEPKKYKSEAKTKDESTSLSNDEKKFLREVESKFGIKSDVPLDKKPEGEGKNKKVLSEGQIKAPFPAVIAIEIVNDTDDKDTPSKGKRTIDANLGYGYQTNNGYAYTYFGQSQNKPKFMYYPYSQEDIPSSNTNAHSSGYTYNTPGSNGHSGKAVEIMPSQAYELVQTKEEPTAYNYEKPSVDFKTEDNIQSVEQPPPSYQTSESYRHAVPQTFYTTYNGQQFSGLSGRFPSVMSNYLVDSSQLLKSSQYQSAGLTQAHFQNGAQQEKKVVPVLVLRVPSSYLKKPTAELYANAPQSVSQYLNVNLQELVNQYFRKLGFHNAPQVMAYQNSGSHEEAVAPEASYEPHKYASPYVQPTYTHADSAGVQYSAVQPVMARYPAGYTRQQNYVNHGQHYQQPQQQQYVYRYRYQTETPEHTQAYYNQAQYSQAQQQQSPDQTQAYYEQAKAYQQAQQLAARTAQQAEVAAQQAQVAAQQAYGQQHHSADQETSHEAAHGHDAAYSQQQETSQEEESASVVYEPTNDHNAANSAQGYAESTPSYETQTVTPQYETHTEISAEYGSTRAPVPSHDDTQTQQIQYEQPQSVEVYPRSQTGHSHPETDSSQTYQYQTTFNGHVGHEADDTLPLSENYPSKDHTIATVLPLKYKSRFQNPEAVQSVSYVTPMPSPMKYHSQYRVMVPQTVFNRPTENKVSYVNSQSIQNAYLQSSRYNGGQSQYAPAARHRQMHYPWNIHSLPKRMVRLQKKSDTETVPTNDKPSSS